MTAITLRQGLMRPLTIAEVDANFFNLNAEKIERIVSVNDATPAISITQAGAGLALDVLDGDIRYATEIITTSTSALQVPFGDTASRPTGANGKIRFNLSTVGYEGFRDGVWKGLNGLLKTQVENASISQHFVTFQFSDTDETDKVLVSSKLRFTPATGNLSSDLFTGPLSGNASTATKLETVRTITVAGAVSGSASFDGSANITITVSPVADSIVLGTHTTGNYAKSVAVSGIGLSVSPAPGEGTDYVITSNATSANTPSTVVSRDASGNFSAGVITADLVGVASQATALQNTRTFSITGDATAPAQNFNGTQNVTLTVTLANSGVTAGTYRFATVVVNSKGLVTSAIDGEQDAIAYSMIF